MYEASAERWGVPHNILMALIRQESGNNPAAVGDNGASVGLGQFNVKGALADFGLTREQLLAMPAEQQADLTAQFLSQKIKQAKGDVWGGVQRYNGGGDPNYLANVQRHMGGADVRQAQNRTGSTDTDHTPSGDPRTGSMIQSGLPAFSMPPPQPEPQRPAMMDWAMPLMSLLAGAAMSSGKGFDRVLSGAGLAGEALSATQTAENDLLELKQKREDARRRRQSQDAISNYAQQLSLNPETAEIGAAMQVDPGAGLQMYSEYRKAQQAGIKPPVMQETNVGDQTVTSQWDKNTGTWQEVGRSPRWAPPATTSPYGGVPQGMQRIPDAASPTGTTLVPEPGSPQAVERTAKIEPLKAAIGRIDRMQKMIDKHGSTNIWGEDAGTTRQMYSQIVADVAKLRDMGVIQPGELTNIEASLVNPSSWGSITSGDESVKAQYNELRRAIAEKLRGLGADVPQSQDDDIDAQIQAMERALNADNFGGGA